MDEAPVARVNTHVPSIKIADHMEILKNYSYDPEISDAVSLSGYAIRSSFFIFIAKAVRYSFVFIVQMILMNLLAPADFGLLRLVTIVIGFITLINDMGLSIAVVQKKSLADAELASSFSFNLLLGMVLYAVLFLLVPFYASYIGNPRLTLLIRVGALSSLFGALSVVHRGLLQRRFCYGRLAAIEICSAVAGSASAVILALYGFGVWALLSSMFIFNTLSSLLLFLTASWPKGNYLNPAAAKRLCFFGAGVVVQRIIDYGAQNIDYLVVGKAFGEKMLGIYSIAFTIIDLPLVGFGVVVSSVLLAAFSRMQKDNERLSQAFLRLNALTSVISVPYYVLVFSFSREIMHAVSFINHGDTWLPAAAPLHILAALGLLGCLKSYPGTLWLSKGKVKLRVIWALLNLVSMIIAVVAGRPFGIAGICYSLLVRGLIFFPIMLFVTYKVIGLSPFIYIKTLAPAVSCGIVMVAFTLSFSKLVPGVSFTRDIGTLGTGMAGGLMLYCSMLFIFFRTTCSSFFTIVASLKTQ